MSTSLDYIEFVLEQIDKKWKPYYKKMFGDYIVYINDKPILLVCDNCVYVKMLPCLEDTLINAEKGIPYSGSKEHFILDIENTELIEKVISIIEPITPFPKKRKV